MANEMAKFGNNGIAKRGEVDIQISTAHTYPRSIKTFMEKAMSMATLDEDTASSCFYSLPRGGKSIEGPSVRLAEIAKSAWGNIRAKATIIDEDERYIYAEGMAWDLETNDAVSVEVRRRITDKNGKKFNDDMIGTTANAACSIALRNAIFRVIPMAYVNQVYDQAKRVAIGDVKTLANRRNAMVAHFGKMGITPERLLATIEKPSVEDIGIEDLGKLKGMATAIKDGELSIDNAFPDPKARAVVEGRVNAKLSDIINKTAPQPSAAHDAIPQPQDEIPQPEHGDEGVIEEAAGKVELFEEGKSSAQGKI